MKKNLSTPFVKVIQMEAKCIITTSGTPEAASVHLDRSGKTTDMMYSKSRGTSTNFDFD